MRESIDRLTRRVPAQLQASVALAALVIVASIASALTNAPRTLVASPSRTGTAEPSAIPTPSAAHPTPLLMPVAFARATDVGGVIFQASGAVWRYDGPTGSISRIGRYGRPTGDGRHFLVWSDRDGSVSVVDASTGSVELIGPARDHDADWAAGTSAYLIPGVLTYRRHDAIRQLQVDATFVRVSPDGGKAIAGGTSGRGLVLVDLDAGRVRALGTTDGGAGKWSPDGRYFAYSSPTPTARDGVPFHVVDTENGTVTDLGLILVGEAGFTWASPHTLAYVYGGGRETWSGKTMRIWTPERGAVDVTDARHVGLAPSWSGDGRTLYFVTAPQAAYDPLRFFAGWDAGDRSIAAYDPAVGTWSFVGPRPGYAVEGVRPSSDRSVLLTVQRRTVIASSLDSVHVSLELIVATPDGQHTERLARIATDVGFGYYGSYGTSLPGAMAWSR